MSRLDGFGLLAIGDIVSSGLRRVVNRLVKLPIRPTIMPAFEFSFNLILVIRCYEIETMLLCSGKGDVHAN